MTFSEAMAQMGYDWSRDYRRIYDMYGHDGLDFWERCIFGRVVSR